MEQEVKRLCSSSCDLLGCIWQSLIDLPTPQPSSGASRTGTQSVDETEDAVNK